VKLQKFQIDHAKQRLQKAMAEKVAKVVGPQPKVNRIPEDKRLAMIYSGKATMKPRAANSAHVSFVDAFDYPDTKYDAELARKKAWEARRTALYAEEQRKVDLIVDRLILSGAAEALALIEDYANGAG
jgi:hypothetical protein